jgi:excisionase family DNA binding protein
MIATTNTISGDTALPSAPMTVKQVAELLQCTRGVVYNLLHQGRLERITLGHRSIRITRSSVISLMNGKGGRSA